MADIGPTLRDARLRAQIDMSQVENQTKIRAKYLRAIEHEEWDLLPGPVYVKSFLRTYGDYLGLDSRMLVEEFKRRYERPYDNEPAPPMASLSRERKRDRMPRPSLPPWAPIAFVLVVIVAALFIVGTVFGGSNKSSNPKGLRATTPRHRAKSTAAHTQTAAAAPKPPQAVTLQLTPTARLYVCLVNAHGRFLIYEQTFSPGQTIPTTSGRKLLLTLGNANVQIKVNGKPVQVTQSNSAIRLQLTPDSVQPIAMTQTPTCP